MSQKQKEEWAVIRLTISSWVNTILWVIDRRAFVSDSASFSWSIADATSSLADYSKHGKWTIGVEQNSIYNKDLDIKIWQKYIYLKFLP